MIEISIKIMCKKVNDFWILDFKTLKIVKLSSPEGWWKLNFDGACSIIYGSIEYIAAGAGALSAVTKLETKYRGPKGMKLKKKII